MNRDTHGPSPPPARPSPKTVLPSQDFLEAARTAVTAATIDRWLEASYGTDLFRSLEKQALLLWETVEDNALRQRAETLTTSWLTDPRVHQASAAALATISLASAFAAATGELSSQYATLDEALQAGFASWNERVRGLQTSNNAISLAQLAVLEALLYLLVDEVAQTPSEHASLVASVEGVFSVIDRKRRESLATLALVLADGSGRYQRHARRVGGGSEGLIRGQVHIREWRDEDSGELKTEVHFGTQIGELALTLSSTQSPPWWSRKEMTGFEIAHVGLVAQPETWPPPWPYLCLTWTGQPDRPAVVRLERKRIYRRVCPAFYAEIRLPDALDGTRQVEPATFHGITAATPEAELLVLRRATKVAYLAATEQWGHAGRRRGTRNLPPQEFRTLARQARENLGQEATDVKIAADLGISTATYYRYLAAEREGG